MNLTRRAENKYIGLNNGILDQTSIVFGEKGHLLHIDTVDKTVAKLPDQRAERDYRIIVAYSGYSRELTTSGYNSRVDECRLAAAELSRLSGRPGAEVLSGVERSVFDRFESELQPHIRRRATHFFGESQRVMDGLTALRNLMQLTPDLKVIMVTSLGGVGVEHRDGLPPLEQVVDEVSKLPRLARPTHAMPGRQLAITHGLDRRLPDDAFDQYIRQELMRAIK